MAQNRKFLSLDEAEDFVSRTPGASWEGWTLLIWKPARNRAIFTKPYAAFNPEWKGVHKWGTLRRIEPNSKGMYVV